MIDWKIVSTLVMATIGLMFAIYKWIVFRADKRHEAHDKRFSEHNERFSRHESRIEQNEKLVGTTRDEVHRDYVRVGQIDKLMGKFTEEITQVHNRLGSIAKDLNQAIGSIKASSDAEMKNLVSEIKDALKHRND